MVNQTSETGGTNEEKFVAALLRLQGVMPPEKFKQYTSNLIDRMKADLKEINN